MEVCFSFSLCKELIDSLHSKVALEDRLKNVMIACQQKFKLRNFKTYEDRVKERIQLLDQFDSIQKIEEHIIQKYKLFNNCSEFKINFSKNIYFIYYLLFNIPIHSSIKDDFCYNEALCKQFYIRLILLQKGWNYMNIEKFIIRTLNSYILTSFDYEYVELNYTFLSHLLQLFPNKKHTGRPKLPDEVKKICSLEYKSKNKKRMSHIYKFYYTFTTEDLLILKSYCVQHENNVLEEKIDSLLQQ